MPPSQSSFLARAELWLWPRQNEGMCMNQQPSYHAYLLRVWRNGTGARSRASLEDPNTGERHGFAGLAEALSFLEAQLQSTVDSDKPEEGEAGL